MRQRGKKVEMIWIEEGAQRHHVELRFDKERGDFFANFGDIELSAETFPELKVKLRERAKLLIGYEYKWYIELSFSVEQGEGTNHSWGRDWEDLEEHIPIVGLNFAFQVVERSQAIKTDEMDYDRTPYWLHMERPVEEIDGKLQPKGAPKAERTAIGKGKSPDHTDVIEFTPERYAKLAAIRSALHELARRLHDLVGGEPAKVTKAIDGMTPRMLLLDAPPVEIESGRCQMCGNPNATVKLDKGDVKKRAWAAGLKVGGFVCDECSK